MFNQRALLLAFPTVDLSWVEFTTVEFRSGIVLTAFIVFAAIESRFGYINSAVKTIRQSYFTNLNTFIFNDAMMSLLSVSSLLVVAERFSRYGLLGKISHPLAKAAAAFICLDLTLYLWHRANHACEWLWMFHKVHHSDRHMNVTTAFRLHFMEVLLTTIVKAVFIVVIGVDTAILLTNEVLITLGIMFHHTNISFRGEIPLGRMIIVPYLHRVHHSIRRHEHDNNYGAILSLWDRMFGTLAKLEPAELGLENVTAHNFLALVKCGLMRTNSPPFQPPLQAMIAEAAYYKAEKRNFMPGNEWIDWLEAEKDIASRYMGTGRPLFR